MAQKWMVLGEIDTAVANLLWYDRNDDEQLSKGVIDKMVQNGEITIDEMVDEFRGELNKHIDTTPVVVQNTCADFNSMEPE